MLKILIPTLICLCSHIALSQIPSSLSLSPYSGIERVQLNPALGTASVYPWEINLAGAHVFAHTDYGFVRQANLLNLSGQLSEAEVIDGISFLPEQSSIPLIIFDLDGGEKTGFLNARINGPGFTASFREGTRLGLFSSFRLHGSAPTIPVNFGFYELNASYDTEIINIDPAGMAAASWLEIGAHFSKDLETLTFGVNLKYLRAHEGLYINSDTDENYQFIDSIITVPPNVNFDLGFTTSSINANSLQSNFNGGGISIDLGARMQLENLELGLSILDIGALQFSSNVEIYSQSVLSTITEIRTQDFRNFNTFRDFLDQLQNDLNIIPDVFSAFSIGLPTRLSLYGDYQYNESIAISALVNQRLPLFGNSLKSANTLVFTPRWESDLISVFLPVSIFEYSSIRPGLAFRIGPLTIGSDHITSVFVPTDFKGSDIFFALKIYPFNIESARSSGGRKSRRGKGVQCPIF